MIISWGHDLKSETINHLVGEKASEYAIYDIQSMLENAIYFNTEISMPTSKTKMPNTAFMHSFYSLYKTDDGGLHLIKIFVEEALSNNENVIFKRGYQLKDIKKVADIPNGVHSANGGLTEDTSTTTYSISDLYNFVKTYDKDFSPAPTVSEAVLNEDGTPNVFYHGTNARFTEFKSEEIALREGSYFFAENREDAAAYGDNILEVYLSGRNLADYDNQPREFYQLKSKREQAAWLKERGYDGWYADMDSDGWGELSVFSNEQIKSATDNIGTFSKYDNDIRYSYKAPAESKVYKQIAKWEKLKVYEKADAEKMLYTILSDVMTLSEDQAAVMTLEGRKDAEQLLWAEPNKKSRARKPLCFFILLQI